MKNRHVWVAIPTLNKYFSSSNVMPEEAHLIRMSMGHQHLSDVKEALIEHGEDKRLINAAKVMMEYTEELTSTLLQCLGEDYPYKIVEIIGGE